MSNEQLLGQIVSRGVASYANETHRSSSDFDETLHATQEIFNLLRITRHIMDTKERNTIETMLTFIIQLVFKLF